MISTARITRLPCGPVLPESWQHQGLMQQSSLTPTTHRNPHNNWRLWPHNHLLKSKHQVDLRGWNCAVCPFWESAGSGNQLRLCARRGGCCCHAAVKRTSAAYCMMMMMIHGVASCNTYCLEYLTPITSVGCRADAAIRATSHLTLMVWDPLLTNRQIRPCLVWCVHVASGAPPVPTLTSWAAMNARTLVPGVQSARSPL